MERMPVLFLGHGSPMNAIEANAFSEGWLTLGKTLPRPKAILSVSAHWYTQGTRVMTQADPQQIYDFYGFPKALYELNYPVQGAPREAKRTLEVLGTTAVSDTGWGIDHGTWSVLCRLFPDGDVPVFQLSIDSTQPFETHYGLGDRLKPLRDEGVMILGSGNIVHSFRGARFDMASGHPWAYAFDDYIHDRILAWDHENIIRYQNAGECAFKAFETPDHYIPLLYTLGAAAAGDEIRVINRACVYGGFSMTGYMFT